MDLDQASGAYLEVSTTPVRLIPLADKVTIGRDASHDIAFPDDLVVSRLHAIVERHGSGWSVRDLSRNGTFVNGQRVAGERTLQPGDEISVGSHRLVLNAHGVPLGGTLSGEGPPRLTTREKEVLIELCRPLLSGVPFPQPATDVEIAARLIVTRDAVKSHVRHLTQKFGLQEASGRRRVVLANEAITRRAVDLSDLRSEPN